MADTGPMHDRATIFQQHTPRLSGLASRRLGSRADAEDVRQEPSRRWHQADPAGVQTPEAWLVTTVTRRWIDRRRVRRHRPRVAVLEPAHLALLHPFVAAVHARDQDERLAPLAEDATWTSDGGDERVVAARRVVRGAERLTRFALGIARRSQGKATDQVAPSNGAPGVRIRLGRLHSILALDPDGTHILAAYNVLNPQKWRGVALPEPPAP